MSLVVGQSADGYGSGNMAILDWRVGPKYILKLLQCQHEQKVSPISDFKHN